MPSQYNGLPALIVPLPAVNIASSTNANPIVVTTSAAHNMTTGDYATIANHQVNTSANGANQAVTVLSPTTFSIARIGVGVGGATGTVQPLSVGATFATPSDGDAHQASAYNVAFDTLGDRSAFLGAATGVAKLTSRLVWTWPDVTGAFAWSLESVTAVAATWYPFPLFGGRNLTLQGGIAENGGAAALTVQPPFTVTGLSGINDAVRVSLACDVGSAGSTAVRVGLFYAVTVAGAAAPVFPGGYSPIPGCSQMIISGGTNSSAAVRLEGWIPNGGAGTLYIQPAIYSGTVTGLQNWTLQGDSIVVVEIWRGTGMPQ